MNVESLTKNVSVDNGTTPQSANVLMCKQWWKVCWMYGDQEKYYRQLYGNKRVPSVKNRHHQTKNINRTNKRREQQQSKTNHDYLLRNRTNLIDNKLIDRTIEDDVDTKSTRIVTNDLEDDDRQLSFMNVTNLSGVEFYELDRDESEDNDDET